MDAASPVLNSQSLLHKLSAFSFIKKVYSKFLFALLLMNFCDEIQELNWILCKEGEIIFVVGERALYFLGNVIEPFPKNAEKFRKFRKQAVDGF